MGTIRKQETQRDAKSLACDWYSVDGHRNSVSLFVYPETSIAEMYGASLGFSYFDRAGPLIDGYPIVRKSQLANGPQNGDCITEVAVANRATIAIYAYTITKSDPNYQNMCSVSDTLVKNAVDNLRPGGYGIVQKYVCAEDWGVDMAGGVAINVAAAAFIAH